MRFACVVCGRASDTRYCAAHGASNKRPGPRVRGYGRAFLASRRTLLATRPLCARGCGRLANTAHHNPPRKQLVARGITDPDALRWLEPLCPDCHAAETRRGR